MVLVPIRMNATSKGCRGTNCPGWRSFYLMNRLMKLCCGAVAPSSIPSGSSQRQVAWMITGTAFSIISLSFLVWFDGTLTMSTFRKSGKLLGFLGVHRMGWKSKGQIVIKNLTDQIITHPQWNRTTRNADIALIRLNIDVPYTCKSFFINSYQIQFIAF